MYCIYGIGLGVTPLNDYLNKILLSMHSTFSSFHLHPHKCSSAAPVILSRNPSQHSTCKHLRTESPYHHCSMGSCCDVTLRAGKRNEDLTQILKKFQRMNEEMVIEERKLAAKSKPKPKQEPKSIPTKPPTKIESIPTPISKPSTPSREIEISVSPPQRTHDSSTKTKTQSTHSAPLKTTMKETFLTSHQFQHLTEHQQQIIWKLQQLMNKADGITSLCSIVSNMLVDEQNRTIPVPSRHLPFETTHKYPSPILPLPEQAALPGMSLNEAFHALNHILKRENDRQAAEPSQIKDKSTDRSMLDRKPLKTQTSMSVGRFARLTTPNRYDKRKITQESKISQQTPNDISFNKI